MGFFLNYKFPTFVVLTSSTTLFIKKMKSHVNSHCCQVHTHDQFLLRGFMIQEWEDTIDWTKYYIPCA